MNNVYIKGITNFADLNRKVNLHNGSLIILKFNEEVRGIYYVVSFRDNKNKYNGCNTTNYCSIVDLDTGKFVFEERCSRNTTVRRVINHLLRLGYTQPYSPDAMNNDSQMWGYDIDVYEVGKYKIGVELQEMT